MLNDIENYECIHIASLDVHIASFDIAESHCHLHVEDHIVNKNKQTCC